VDHVVGRRGELELDGRVHGHEEPVRGDGLLGIAEGPEPALARHLDHHGVLGHGAHQLEALVPLEEHEEHDDGGDDDPRQLEGQVALDLRRLGVALVPVLDEKQHHGSRDAHEQHEADPADPVEGLVDLPGDV